MKDYSEPCGISLSGRCQNIKPITYLDIVTTKILLRFVIEHFQSERGVLLIMKSMLVTKFNVITLGSNSILDGLQVQVVVLLCLFVLFI